MEAHDAQTIVKNIRSRIDEQGGKPSEWYVGITQDVEGRVFGDHKVSRSVDSLHIECKALNHQAACDAEKALIGLGCNGGPGGGDEDAVFVYAYWKALYTDP